MSEKYVLELLAEIGMLDCKPAESPMVMNHGLRVLEEAEPASKES